VKNIRKILIITSLAILVFIIMLEFILRYQIFEIKKNAILTNHKDDNLFSFYIWPPPWRFDPEMGFVFNQNPWNSGSFKTGGAVELSSNKINNANSIGNIGREKIHEYSTSDVKVLLFGSSFTLINTPDGYIDDIIEKFCRSQDNEKNTYSVLNFSRDAQGFANMLKSAAYNLEKYCPDYLIMTFNQTAPNYPLLYRHVLPSGPNFYRMYQTPFKKFDPVSATPGEFYIHSQPITSLVPSNFYNLANYKIENEVIKKILVEKQEIDTNIKLSGMLVPNTESLKPIFLQEMSRRLLKKINNSQVYKNADLEFFKSNPEMRSAISHLKSKKVKIFMIFIPTYNEYLSGKPDFGSEGKKIVDLLEQEFGTKTINLADEINREENNPLKLVNSKLDNHPSIYGTKILGIQIGRIILRD